MALDSTNSNTNVISKTLRSQRYFILYTNLLIQDREEEKYCFYVHSKFDLFHLIVFIHGKGYISTRKLN